MEEKRRYLRFNVLLDALWRTGGALRRLKINDFSRGGIGILSEGLLPGEKELELELMIPGDNVPVVVTGQIAWTSERNTGRELYRSGMRLKKIDSADRGRILNYIYRKWMKPKTQKQVS